MVEWWSTGISQFAKHPFNRTQNLFNRDPALLHAGRDQRSKGFAKVKRIDLVQRDLAVLKIVKQFSISTAARTKWFHGDGAVTCPAQVREQKPREDCLPHPGVCAGDEYDFRLGMAGLLAHELECGSGPCLLNAPGPVHAGFLLVITTVQKKNRRE